MFDNDTNELVLDFDTGADEYAVADNDYSPIPEGIYEARVERVETRPTRDGTGKRLLLLFRIIGPSHVGRTVLVGLNVVNRSEKAQSISRRQLAQLLDAVGLPGERDMSQLVDRECAISVVIRPAEGEYEASNDVKRFGALETVKSETTKPATPKARRSAPSFMR